MRRGVLGWAQRLVETGGGGVAGFEIAATLLGSGGIGITPGSAARAIAQGVREANERLAGVKWPQAERLVLVELYLERASEARRGLRVQDTADPGTLEVDPHLASGPGALRQSLDALPRHRLRPDPRRVAGRRDDRLHARLAARAQRGPRPQHPGPADRRDRRPRVTARARGRAARPHAVPAAGAGRARALPRRHDDDGARGRRGDGADPVGTAGDAGARARRRRRRDAAVGDPLQAAAQAARDAVPRVRRRRRRRRRGARRRRASCQPKTGYGRLPGARAEAARRRRPVPRRRRRRRGPRRRADRARRRRRRRADDRQRADGAALPHRPHRRPRRGRRRRRRRALRRHLPRPEGDRGDAHGARTGVRQLLPRRAQRRRPAARRAAGRTRRASPPGSRDSLIEHRRALRRRRRLGRRRPRPPRPSRPRCYRALLAGSPFIDAVASAREAAWAGGGGGNTWAAYQCYGDPNWTFRESTADGQAPRRRDDEDEIASQAGLALVLEEIAIGARFGTGAGHAERLARLEGRFEAIWGGSGATAEAFGRAWAEVGHPATRCAGTRRRWRPTTAAPRCARPSSTRTWARTPPWARVEHAAAALAAARAAAAATRRAAADGSPVSGCRC
ncbi:MAG: hypothetical protein MZW92_19310 [Comamonadaceae bacterium]|nr:hypothetical protein [Comamonadaceae bacterium]